MNIIFYDGVSPHQYDFNSIEERPMGGTEATVIRVSWGLILKGFKMFLLQPKFDNKEPEFKPHIVITLRDAGHYIANQIRWPNAKHFLWLHDVVSGDYQKHLQHHLNGHKGTIVTVSDYHHTNVISTLQDMLKDGNLRVKRVYNPLADYCVKEPVEIDRYKLVYFSSPHKGLDYVLKLHQYLRNIEPKFHLFLANPGYYANKDTLTEGVTNLGILKHKEVVDQVRTSLCVFYPNTSFPETFGLVYAEADAVGTPVLTHPIGAAREVLFHPHEVMDCRDYRAVVNRVIAWSNGDRPIVTGKKEFRLDSVVNEWVKLFNS